MVLALLYTEAEIGRVPHSVLPQMDAVRAVTVPRVSNSMGRMVARAVGEEREIQHCHLSVSGSRESWKTPVVTAVIVPGMVVQSLGYSNQTPGLEPSHCPLPCAGSLETPAGGR